MLDCEANGNVMVRFSNQGYGQIPKMSRDLATENRRAIFDLFTCLLGTFQGDCQMAMNLFVWLVVC